MAKEDFKESWRSMIERFELEKNEWLESLFENSIGCHIKILSSPECLQLKSQKI